MASADQPPNVVLILGDDQAWTDFGFMGHKEIRTPHLDRLAAQSATFPRGYVPSSLCRPSLATLLTGRYPHEHRICGNDPPKGTDRRELLRHIRAADTIPKWLGTKGYTSFQSGKWWEGNFTEGGFTAGMTHGDPTKGGRHGDLGLKIGREGIQPVADFLKTNGTKPFFLWFAPMLPHTPHNPPERLLAKYQQPDRPLPIARYYAMCEWWDETVGELLALLDQRGLTDNTLVVFVTDNGWIQQPSGNGYAPKSKRSPYDGGLRAPMLVRWPGKVPVGRFETPVSSVDIAPTMLAAAGIESPKSLPGRDLIAIAKDNGQTDRAQLFGEIFEHDVADIDRPAASLLFRWTLAEGRWKLIVPHGTGEAELYDVVADPLETENLATRQPEIVQRLTRSLDAWWTPQ
jgi:arylsulfatase A-like enzyme